LQSVRFTFRFDFHLSPWAIGKDWLFFHMKFRSKDMNFLGKIVPISLLLILLINVPLSSENQVKGVVFHDKNGNGVYDKGEKGIANVLVSNQLDVVKTDRKGEFEINLEGPATLFITKPAGWELPINEQNLPQFYLHHYPAGSPTLKFEGISATSPLPERIEFPLMPSKKSKQFKVLVFSDPQPRNATEVDYIRDDVIAELVNADAALCIPLGDLLFDNLSLFPRYNAVMAQLGLPVWNVPGNHDMNFDASDDTHSLETYKRWFGPEYYSFDEGDVHFVVMDNIEWTHDENGKGYYFGNFGEKQLQWLQNDLSFVSPKKLIVFAFHIPLWTQAGEHRSIITADRAEFFDILKERENLLILNGHMHMLEHQFFGEEDGWTGKKPLHQIITAAVSGSWWSGPKNEFDIPVATQRDGAPNGWHVFHFNGSSYSQDFIGAGYAADYQMRISAPLEGVFAADLLPDTMIVNVFNGHQGWKLSWTFDGKAGEDLENYFGIDPQAARLITQHPDMYRSWIKPEPTNHLWKAPLPKSVSPGIHRISVTAINPAGKKYESHRLFWVED
jgi:hypothetical protein